MDLIVSHTNADFDALAGMVAASLLYPGAVMSVPGGLDRNVRDYLSLHSDVINLLPPHEVPLDEVTRLIVIETQHAQRLGCFAELLDLPEVEVILYDHHVAQATEIRTSSIISKPLGAVTTLLVGMLRERDIPVDAMQATLFTLGIYEDTGSLTFGGTTAEDVEAVAWLMRRGANLDLVATFINRALSDEQQQVLLELLTNAERRTIHGIHLMVATAEAGAYVDELALLAHKLRDVSGSDALFLLIRMDDSVLVVARSHVEAVNAGKIARLLGGGGHDRAASATLHKLSVEEVKSRLMALLERDIHPRVTAATIMSFPIRTIPSSTTMDEAARLMLRYGYSGMTVADEGSVVGTVTRRDIDRARHHGLGHAPVRGYMHRGVATLSPDTPLPEIERIMIERRAGRLPVIDNGQLVGIVTRSDVLRAMHGERKAERHALYRESEKPGNIMPIYDARMPVEDRALLAEIARVATAEGMTIFLVGGAVRDLLLGHSTIDLDILVEGEGISLARAVGERLGGHVVTHPKFHTGKVEFPGGGTVDFATARTEFYQFPAALPIAEHSSVREDLYRRDFTINAMAMQLNGDEPGRLLDPFGGERDLQEGILRVLHNLSFVEDPTRILRAVRFEARLGFRMDARTEELARHAMEERLLDRVSGERIREEFLQLFSRPAPAPALIRMDELGILAALEPHWRAGDPAPEYARLEAAMAWANLEPAISSHLIDPAEQRLLLIFAHLGEEHAAQLASRLRLPQRLQSLARLVPRLHDIIAALHNENLSPSAIDDLLHPLPVPLYLVLLALTDDLTVIAAVQHYIKTVRNLPHLLTGDDVKRLGVPRGPEFGQVMHEVRAAQLDGKISTLQEALALVSELTGLSHDSAK